MALGHIGSSHSKINRGILAEFLIRFLIVGSPLIQLLFVGGAVVVMEAVTDVDMHFMVAAMSALAAALVPRMMRALAERKLAERIRKCSEFGIRAQRARKKIAFWDIFIPHTQVFTWGCAIALTIDALRHY